MYAKIIGGRVVELSEGAPDLGPSECCQVAEVGGDVRVGWRWIPQGCTAPGADDVLLAQIASLEAQQTPRRIREATLTEEGRAWLEYLDQQISELRGQL